MSDSEDSQPLGYGRQVRRRHRAMLLLVPLFLAVGIGTFLGWNWLWEQYHRREVFHALFHAQLPARRYVMNDPTDAVGNIDRMRTAWLVRNGPFVVSTLLFRAMTSCNSGGASGVQSSDVIRYPVFIGELRSPSGHRRLMLINFGREGYDRNDAGPNALPHMICQLYSFGSLLNPTIAPVPIKPSADAATRAASTIRGNWQVTVFALMGRATKLETTATAGRAGEPGQVRVPIWFDGQPDELVFALQDDDSIIARPGSGGDLPLRMNVRGPSTASE